MDNTTPLFTITVGDIQSFALDRLGRYLNDDELLTAKKGLEWGLLEGIDVVCNCIFDEMIENEQPYGNH